MVSRYRFVQIPMVILALMVFMFPLSMQAQFEQQLSINLSGGAFKTVGSSGYWDEWSPGADHKEPTLMPNFKTGFSFGGGFQVNINRHLSIEATLGIMASRGWYFDYSGPDEEAYNYLYYEAYTDTIHYIALFTGENDMTLTNLVVGLAPRYYFFPGKKLNPYAFAGVNYSITRVNFIDNEYEDFKAHGRLDELGGGDPNTWFSTHSGIGMSLGAGMEFGLNDYVGLFAQAGYYFTPLKEEAFYDGLKYVDFHAINLHLGLRLSFMKAKDL